MGALIPEADGAQERIPARPLSQAAAGDANGGHGKAGTEKERGQHWREAGLLNTERASGHTARTPRTRALWAQAAPSYLCHGQLWPRPTSAWAGASVSGGLGLGTGLGTGMRKA